ncbi:MAG: transposase [Synergistaceae bacterium]|nr:transposase [Synergistaceae bacterium]
MDKYQNRKTNRLKEYDYSLDGAYFLTICVKDKCRILGKIAEEAAGLVQTVELSEMGEMVKLHIENIKMYSEFVKLDKYVIMPNHVHLIISIESGTTLAYKDGSPRSASPAKAVIPQIVNALKSLTSKKYGKSIWQRSYYDHIIRNEADYREKWEYIDTNPLRWGKDEYYL